MRYIELDEAVERLLDYIGELVAYVCKKCEREFYCTDDTAKFCPHCGGEVETLYERYVEILDWGWRK